MKLSTAIREGSKLLPMTKEGFFIQRDENTQEPIATCAMGAAAFLCEIDPIDLNEAWPEIDLNLDGGRGPRIIEGLALDEIITTLNDETDMTREDIADMLEAMGL